MTENAIYWIWLQQALGAGARTDEILAAFSTAQELYHADDKERRISGALTANQLERLEKTPLRKAENILERCAKLEQDVVTIEDTAYPAALRTLSNAPLVLYVQGSLFCLENTLAIAVVGSRNASLYSLSVTRSLTRDLARAGTVIVSGCARGVDSAAHEGALAGLGQTIGVLGCGLDTPYLMENAALRRQVSQNGALVTEYPPGTGASRTTFPIRNRIISGLCSGVLVVEAGERSGSLITTRCAVEQGRDVFGVPGDLTSRNFTGVHRLIRDGAKPVFSARDILDEYMWVYDNLKLPELADQPLRPAKTKRPQPAPAVKRPASDALSADARAVYDRFGSEPLYTDDLVRATGFEPNRVFTALTELEIFGFIRCIEGKRYTIKE